MTHPILSAQFFDKFSPDLGFFTKWQSLYPWHDQLMPIYEWQGVLFVGCTHIPTQWTVKSPKVVFVLCDSESLKSVWYNFEGTVVVSRQASGRSSDQAQKQQISPSIRPQIPTAAHAAIVPSEVPQKSHIPRSSASSERPFEISELSDNSDYEATLSSPDLEASSQDEILDLTLGESNSQALDLSLNEKPLAPPIDISLESANQLSSTTDDEDLASPNLNLANADELSLNIEEEPSLTLNHPNTPPGINLKVPKSLSTQSGQPSNASLDPMEALIASTGISLESTDSEESESPEQTSGTETETEVPLSESSDETEMGLLDLGNSSSPPVLNEDHKTPGIESTESSLSLHLPPESVAPLRGVSPAETAARSPDNNRTPATSSTSKPTSKSAIKNPHLEPWVEKAFSEIKLEYRKVMILLKQGDTLKPWRWDEEFVASQPINSPFSLVAPSPFRIVQRTHKSYHGYIVENEANKKYLDQWNGGEIPEHMTVVPILNQNNMLGVILAIGNKTADTKGCLQLMEDKAQELASHVQLASVA